MSIHVQTKSPLACQDEGALVVPPGFARVLQRRALLGRRTLLCNGSARSDFDLPARATLIRRLGSGFQPDWDTAFHQPAAL